MRVLEKEQVKMGTVPINEIELPHKSRDQYIQTLIGLQYIYINQPLRHKVFEVLDFYCNSTQKSNKGRTGMALWNILVLGMVKFCSKMDFDFLETLANDSKALRQMLMHGCLDEDYTYKRQTLCDNINLLPTEAINEISRLTVEAGLTYLDLDSPIHCRVDSFVVETNVNFPTDRKLLFDAVRKTMELTARLNQIFKVPGTREVVSNLKKLKKLYHRVNKASRSTSKDKLEKKRHLNQAYENFYNRAVQLFLNYQDILKIIINENDVLFQQVQIDKINYYSKYAKIQFDLINRRVFNDEVIPNEEKIHSIFEPYTEWLSKGKTKAPVELGLNVCIVESEHKFILHHHIMKHETDNDIAVKVIEDTKLKFSTLNSASFDKGFHSPKNQKKLDNILDVVVLPKKGKLSPERKEVENSPTFKKFRRLHSGVESAINALEHHGLDRCTTKGEAGFHRHVGLAVLSRNIQILGRYIQLKETDKLDIKQKKAA